jgi:hypothetical protein
MKGITQNLKRTAEKTISVVLAFMMIAVTVPFVSANAASPFTASDYSSLCSAITNASSRDAINITADIVVSAQVTIGKNKNLTIYGNGHTISVPIPGLDDSGILNSNASAFRVFFISGGTVTLNNMIIKGGRPNDLLYSGAGIYNDAGAILHLNYVTISNSGGAIDRNFYPKGYGGGISNFGIAYLNSCNISRNGATFGGGFYSDAVASMFIENSTFSENRSLGLNGGGGAGQSKGYLYVNNSTFANNKSTELGGAINQNAGTAYIFNSTFTGNVGYNSDYPAGAIRSTTASLYLANCLFAYNYSLNKSGTYDLNEFWGSKYPTAAYNCIFQATNPSSLTGSGNTQFTGDPTGTGGSNDALFVGGATSTALSTTGTPVGLATVYQPFLYKANGSAMPTVLLKPGSTAIGKGTKTGFTNGGGTPTMGYYNGSSWVTLVGSNSLSYQVTTDQNGITRAATPAVGAVETTASNLNMLKVNAAGNGTVDGGTIYGDVYRSCPKLRGTLKIIG